MLWSPRSVRTLPRRVSYFTIFLLLHHIVDFAGGEQEGTNPVVVGLSGCRTRRCLSGGLNVSNQTLRTYTARETFPRRNHDRLIGCLVQQSLVDASAAAYRLSSLRYEKGTDIYLNVLDAQRSLYSAQQGLISIRLSKLTNQVQLYAVLGGGGDVPD